MAILLYTILYLILPNLYGFFDINNIYIIQPNQSYFDMLFGFDFEVIINQNNTKILVGSPKLKCIQNVSCGGVYLCEINYINNSIQCNLINSIYNEFQQLYHNDLIGYYIQKYQQWGILICAPLKGYLIENYNHWLGWCAKLDDSFNITYTQKGYCENDKNDTINRISLGYSSTYIPHFDNIIISNPLNYGGRGKMTTYDQNLQYENSNFLGYLPNTYPGMIIKSLKLDNIKNQTYILYSTENNEGKSINIFVMEKTFKNKLIVTKIISLSNIIDENLKYDAQTGFDILVMDINGDEYDDIIVSSPYASNGKGIVTQYISQRINNKFHKFQKIQIIEGYQNNNLFGYSMTTISDINNDGIRELVISAPYEKNHTNYGSIYIYLSNKTNGFNNQYFHKLSSDEFNISLTSFGIKIKSHFDINNDTFDDIAISSPLDNKIIILKTKPVIIINHTISHYNPYISPNNLKDLCFNTLTNITYNCLKINICFFIINKNTSIIINTAFNYIDNRINVYFDENTIHVNNINCYDIYIEFILPINNFIKPIDIKFTYKYESNEIVPIYLNNNTVSMRFFYKNECKNQLLCKNDVLMIIKNDTIHSELIIGKIESFKYSLIIKSLYEPIYNSYLKIYLSPGLEIITLNYIEWNPQNIEMFTNYDQSSIYIIQLPIIFNKNINLIINIELSTNQFLSINNQIYINFTLYNSNSIIGKVYSIKKNIIYNNIYIINGSISSNHLFIPNHNETSQQLQNTLYINYFITNYGPSYNNTNTISIYLPYIYDKFIITKIYAFQINIPSLCTYQNYTDHFQGNQFSTALNFMAINCQITFLSINQQIKLAIELYLTDNITIILDTQDSLMLHFITNINNTNSTTFNLYTMISKSIYYPSSESIPLWIVLSSVFIISFGILLIVIIYVLTKNNAQKQVVQAQIKSYKRLLKNSQF